MWIETINVVLVLAAAAAPPAAPVTKDAVPDAESQKKALREIQEVYRADLARAAKPSERLPLARKLLQAAGETLADPPGRYELAVSARDIAIEAGAVDPAFAAIDFLEKYFQLDASSMRNDALSRLSHTVRSGEDAKALYKRCDCAARWGTGGGSLRQGDPVCRLCTVGGASSWGPCGGERCECAGSGDAPGADRVFKPERKRRQSWRLTRRTRRRTRQSGGFGASLKGIG